MIDSIPWDIVIVVAIIVAYVVFKIFFQKKSAHSEKTGWAFWLAFFIPWIDF